MDESLLKALDRAIGAGGVNLSKKTITQTTGANSNALIDKLCNAGYLESDGAARPKYTITPDGSSAWEKEAPPERVAEIQEQERRQREQALMGLLVKIEQKEGSAFKAGEQAQFAPVLNEAKSRQLVQPGERADSYELLPAGIVFQLRSQLEAMHEPWDKFIRQIQHQVDDLGDQGGALADIVGDLHHRIKEAQREYEATLDELGNSAKLASAAQRLKQSILAQVDERVAEVEKMLQGLSDLGTKRQELSQRIDQLSEKITSTPDQSQSDSWLESVIRHLAEHQRNHPMQDCPLPELYRAVAEPRGISLGEYHEGLRRLWEQRRIRLVEWTQPLYAMKEERFALILDKEIRFHATIAR